MEYQIGDFSKITRLTIKTLRYYHECGILEPTRIDTWSGYRYYDEKDVEKAQVINNLKSLDFSLKEIKEILLNYTDDSEIIEFIMKKKTELEQKIDKYINIEKKLTMVLKNEEEVQMNNITQEIIIKSLPESLVASVRYKGKYNEMGTYIGKLFKHCARYMSGKVFALYHDEDFKESHADIEVCLPVKKAIEKPGITYRTLPGGQAITIVHKGSYETLGTSYKLLIDYAKNNNIKTTVPSREIYIKGPGMILKGNPKKYLTEIQMITQ